MAAVHLANTLIDCGAGAGTARDNLARPAVAVGCGTDRVHGVRDDLEDAVKREILLGKEEHVAPEPRESPHHTM